MTRRLLIVAAVGTALLAIGLWPRRPASLGPCPDGAQLTGAPLGTGTQEWCERVATDGRRLKDGPYTVLGANGRRTLDGFYRDGVKEGRWVFWDANGRKREEGEFRHDREHGLWTRWSTSGQRVEAGEYQGGVREGRWTFWYENGRKAREGEYRDGSEVSGWRRWTVKGEPCD